MPAAIQFECEVSERGIADFVKALSRYQKETQRDMRGALRSATIDLVKSLRARTWKAPKIVPRDDARWGESDPKYITAKDGRQFRRVVITRWAHGTPRDSVHWQLVRTKYRSRRTKRGGVSESWSEATPAMLLEARQTFGGIRQWGLAKKSWGWFMKSLFGKATQDENPKAVIDGRMVDGGIHEFHDVLPDGSVDRQAPVRCEIDIVNRLEYIRKALYPGALAQAVQAATNSINKKIDSGLKSRRFGS